jgi:hypothetical protein
MSEIREGTLDDAYARLGGGRRMRCQGPVRISRRKKPARLRAEAGFVKILINWYEPGPIIRTRSTGARLRDDRQFGFGLVGAGTMRQALPDLVLSPMG